MILKFAHEYKPMFVSGSKYNTFVWKHEYEKKNILGVYTIPKLEKLLRCLFFKLPIVCIFSGSFMSQPQRRDSSRDVRI